MQINLPETNDILNEVKKNGFIFFENVLDEKIFFKMRTFWIDYFSNNISKSNFSGNVFGVSQRLGDPSFHSFKKDSKVFMHRYKNYPWDKQLHEETSVIARKLHEIRNISMNRPSNYGFEYSDSREAFFTQLNLYPHNGGFLLPHKDGRTDHIMLNCMFSLTFKNKDFDEGGLYVIDKNDKKIDLDSIAKPNSVLFFDGNLTHGVDPIKNLNSGGIGRLAVFPMIQYFLNSLSLPYYLKFLIQADISLRRRLKIAKKVNEGNSQIVKE